VSADQAVKTHRRVYDNDFSGMLASGHLDKSDNLVCRGK